MPTSILDTFWMDVVCETTVCTIESPVLRRVPVDGTGLPDWDSLLISAGFFLEKLLIDDVEQCPEGYQIGAGFWIPYKFLFGGEPCYVRLYRPPRLPSSPPAPLVPPGGRVPRAGPRLPPA